jgi:hypothetical protein
MNEHLHRVCAIEALIRKDLKMMVITYCDRDLAFQVLGFDISSRLDNVMLNYINPMDTVAILGQMNGDMPTQQPASSTFEPFSSARVAIRWFSMALSALLIGNGQYDP